MTTPEHQNGSDISGTVEAAGLVRDPPLPVVLPPAATGAPPSQPKPRRIWPWALGGVLVIGLASALYFQPWASAPLAVTVETATLAPATRVLAVNGRIAARQSVDIRALVSGQVLTVPVDENDTVQKDAIVARINADAPQTVLRHAIAGLDAALVAQAQARDTLTRTDALAGNVTRTALDAASRAVESADQDLARMTALVDQAQVQLETYTIRAPITGTTLAVNTAPGDNIDPSTVLMTIADLTELIVETDVDEGYATEIQMDQPAVLQLTGEATLRDGHVTRVSQIVDAATGGLAVELGFDDPVTAPVGLTVTINIIVDSQDMAITAPRAAILSDDLGQAVFVVVEGVAQRRPVTVIDWPAARLIITDGVEAGDMLILNASGIAEGQAVQVDAP